MIWQNIVKVSLIMNKLGDMYFLQTPAHYKLAFIFKNKKVRGKQYGYCNGKYKKTVCRK